MPGDGGDSRSGLGVASILIFGGGQGGGILDPMVTRRAEAATLQGGQDGYVVRVEPVRTLPNNERD